MAGEHLPLSNYDSLSETEIKEKLDILLENGSPDIQALRDYEKNGQNRSGVTSHYDSLLKDIQGPEVPVSETTNTSPGGGRQTKDDKGGDSK